MITYAERIFTREYEHDDKKLYATFHPEVIVERDEYAATGRYLVVLLHPDKGLQPFFLNKDDNSGQWQINENDPAIVEDSLLSWCNKQISLSGY
ncbi:hypothetical protein [Foetidibacter luteolus]|uniref:hypothetical protein n=1 Tax=Foetidibacter luteolus TaxID=2608880 RepID=UPI00129A3C8F|nr:hypothetical protein [Foetidibacter luteolus]